MNNITKTIMESISELSKIAMFPEEENPSLIDNYQFDIDYLKSHLLQSQIKVVESIIFGLEKAKITKKKGIGEMIFGDGRKEFIRVHTNMDVGYNQALEDQISSLNETLEELKKSL